MNIRFDAEVVAATGVGQGSGRHPRQPPGGRALPLQPAGNVQWQACGTATQARMVDGIALRPLGSTRAIAAATVFPASDSAGFVNGPVPRVNGGR